MKQLVKEYTRLRKAVADLTLDKVMLKKVVEEKYYAFHVANTVSRIFRPGLNF